MTAQEILNTVAQHLIKQGRRSLMPDGVCCYRSHDGLKCPAGYLLTDEEYFPEMEGHNVGYLEYILPLRLVPHMDLIRSCQRVHDNHPVERWPSELRKLAEKLGLNVPEGC